MPTASIEAIRVCRRLGLSATPTMLFYEGATQAFKAGAPVQFASGYITEIQETDGSDYIVNSDDYIVGFTAEPASTTTGTLIGVVPAMPGVTFMANVYHATASSSVLALAQIGVTYGLIQVAKTGHWRIDLAEADTTDSVVKCVGLIDAIGTTHGRMEFVVCAAHQVLFLG